MKKWMLGALALLMIPLAQAIQINGPLQNATLEKVAGQPSAKTQARVYYNTSLGFPQICNGTTCENILTASSTPAASAITNLTGDVSASGPGSVAATVNSVGGSSAANINTGVTAANAATSANTPSTIVARNGSGNFTAGTITANLTGAVTGNASTSSALAADPSDCSAGNLANVIAANGNLSCVQVADSYVASGAAIARSKLGTGTNDHVVINSGAGAFSSEAQLATSRGGTNISSYTTGDLLYASSSSVLSKLGIGTTGQIIKVSGGIPTWTDSSAGGQYAGGTNLLVNNSWEINSSNWTASGGSYARQTAAAHLVPPGVGSASWDPSASSQTLTSDSVTITSNDGLSGRNGVLSCAVKTAATDMKMQAYDGSNVISPNASTDLVPASSTGFVRYSVNFIFPSSGTIAARFLSASNSVIAYVDDCYLGLAENFNTFQVAQANLVAKLTYAHTALCGWSRNNATIGDMTLDTDCPAPTLDYDAGIGTWSTADADLPQITVTNLPTGLYKVTAIFPGSNRGGGASYQSFRLSDGTTNGAIQSADQDGAAGGDTQPFAISALFNYTANAGHTFKIQAASVSQTAFIELASGLGDLVFYVERWPNSQETAYRADLIPGTWSGYHSTDCSWTVTSTSFADPSDDASCTFTERSNVNFGTVSSSGSKAPGVTFTPAKTGWYEVCASVVATHATTGEYVVLQLADASNNELFSTQAEEPVGTYPMSFRLCGNINATSVAAQTVKIRARTNAAGTITINAGISRTIEWSIKPLTQNTPNPYFVGSVSSQTTGQERIERATFNLSGASTVSITRQSGSWLSSATAASTTITANITAGTFSAAPTCVVTCNNSTSAGFGMLNADPTTSVVQPLCVTTAPAAVVASSVNLICMGPK